MGNNISNVDSKPVFIILGGLVTSSSILVVWFFYDRINRATRFDNLKETNCNIEQLNSAIDILRKEIEELKAASSKVDLNNEKDEDCKSKKSFKVVRFKNTLSYMSSTSDVEYQSAWSDNEGSTEEFFDFPENDLGDQINITKYKVHLFVYIWLLIQLFSSKFYSISSEAIDLFDKVDSLLDGSSADHEVAFRLLTDHESEVVVLSNLIKFCQLSWFVFPS